MIKNVSIDPECPECGSMLTKPTKTQRFIIIHDGRQHRAQKQLRKCKCCGFSFPWVRIRERMSTKSVH